MNPRKVDVTVLRLSGLLFVAGGIVHWLIIFGILVEKTPLLIGMYFHSLAVLSAAAGVGLMLLKNWGITLAIWICVTQIPAHLWMMYLDAYTGWNSGYDLSARAIDLLLVSLFLIYVTYRKDFLSRPAR